MHHIEIKNLGPIEYCSMDVNNFMVFTGPQASGKSTIAKAIYFFRSVKDIVLDYALYCIANRTEAKDIIHHEIFDLMLTRFSHLFSDNNDKTELTYKYSPKVEITFLPDVQERAFEITWSDFLLERFILITNLVNDIINRENDNYNKYSTVLNEANIQYSKTIRSAKDLLSIVLNDTFSDYSDCIYIPAGRSIITTLTDHLGYIFTSMDDTQKSSIDYCTRMYVEQVLKLKPVFTSAPHKLINKQKDNNHKEKLKKASIQMQLVLNGYYLNKGSEESIVVDNEYSVKLNYASSGQQETVWLFNILFYYLMEQKNVFIVIEEPESHLFPEAQKSIVELIGLFSKQGQNQVLLTTHSPYILGAVNNLLYASQLDKAGKDVSGIFDKDMLISNDILSSYFIADGKAVDCMDGELQLIEQSVIDGASEKINDDYERLFRLQDEYREDN